jgi:hypothetical protein
MSPAALASAPARPGSSPLRARFGRRLGAMTLMWLGFALAAGALAMPPGGGAVAVIAGMLAGTIVLVPLGVVLGLVGGRWKETLVGGVGGLLLGLLTALLGGQAAILSQGATGLVAGGLVGATLPGLLRRAWTVLAPRLSRAAHPVGTP